MLCKAIFKTFQIKTNLLNSENGKLLKTEFRGPKECDF